MTETTITAARIAGPGREFLIDDEPVDVFVADGTIVDIAPHGALRARGDIVRADGMWLVPGLWDNHVHTVQWALAAEREPLGDATSAADAADRMRNVHPLSDDRRVGSGFRDALWPDRPTLEVLDRATGAVPTYLINADVHSVWLNSAALAREGFRAVDGILREADAFEISRRLNAADDQRADAAVASAGAVAAARGITGLVDFDMAWNADAWPRRVEQGFAAHRVEFAVYPFDLDRAIERGLHTGDEIDGGAGLIHVGSLKIIADGSLGTRTAACSHAYPDNADNFGVLNVSRDDLIDLVARAANAGLEVALHGIGDRAVSAALDAFTIAQASGTIEHAQLVRHVDLARFARLGIAASVQPQHTLDDRDLVAAYWSAQDAIPYPLASLRDAGIRLRFGSDAPVAPLDPWQAISAAVTRTDDDREPWQPQERISVDAAIEASVRTAIRPGERADLVLCARDPRTATGPELRTMPVVRTMLGGHTTFSA